MNKYFDFGLYKESIRQTRLIGIILAIVLIAVSMIGEVGAMIDYNWRATMDHFPRVRTLAFMESTPLLWAFMYLAPLLFVMKTFAFMNKRRASDFYHAIPHTRKSLFISFLAGSFTWMIGIMVAVTLLSTIVYVISPGVAFATSTLVYSFLGFLAGTLLVTSGILLAKGLTGTWFTNLAVAGMILFYPRIILWIFNEMLIDITRIIHPLGSNPLIGGSYNLIFAGLDPYYMWYGMSLDQRGISVVSSITYTFVLALIYIVLAGVLFCKRKSEVAGRGATSRIVQHAIRCMLVFPLTLIIPWVLINPYRQGGIRADEVVGIVVTVFFALVIYFVYELIVTKKLIRVVKAIPALGLVVFFNVLFVFLLIVSRNGVWNNVPKADEIAGVRVITRLSWNPSYNEILTHNIYINDSQVNELVERTFRANVMDLRTGVLTSADNLTRSAPPTVFWHGMGISIQMEDGSTMKRNLRFSPEERSFLLESRFSDETYAQMATKLPEITEDTDTGLVWAGRMWLSTEALEERDVWERAWKIYVQEFEALSLLEQVYHAGMMPNDEGKWRIHSGFGELTVSGTVEGSRFYSTYQLTNLTPNTVEFLMNVANEGVYEEVKPLVEQMIHYIVLDQMSSILSEVTVTLRETSRSDGEDTIGDVFRFCHCESCREDRAYMEEEEISERELQEILQIIMEDASRDHVSLDENLYQLRITVKGEENRDEDVNHVLLVNLSEENRSRINEILGEGEDGL